MVEKGEKRIQLILFLILVMGLAFLSKAFFLQFSDLFLDQTVVRPMPQTSNDENKVIISNVFLDYWNPVFSFISSYHPRGFLIEGYENEGDYYNVLISRQKAAFYVEFDDIDRMLFSDQGKIIWTIPEGFFLESKHYSLPAIYNVSDIIEAEQIIQLISQQSTLFKNYLSSVDAKERIFYLRNGNVLLVNNWNNLEVFDGEGFIYQMGKGQIYDLYSNGRYFPIIKRGE